MAAWSEGYVTLLLDMWLLIISHPSVKFDSHRSCKNEFATFFICYMTLCDHVINRLCDFVDNRPELEPTTLSSLLAIGLTEYNVFYQPRDHLIMCSNRQKTWWIVVLYYKSLPFQVWQSQSLGKWRYIVFLFFTWLQLNSPVCQVRWP